MKLQPDRLDVQSILGYGPGWIGVANQGVAEKIEHSVVIGSRGEKFDWACDRFEDLTRSALSPGWLESRPELVIFGSGTRLRFPPPAFLRGLMAARIGVETMDTHRGLPHLQHSGRGRTQGAGSAADGGARGRPEVTLELSE